MTLYKDREKPSRPPMRRWVFILIVGVAVAVLAFVVITLALTGQSFF